MRRQDARQALREHGLAGAGRAGQQEAVPARRRDLERAPRLRLPLHVREVRPPGAARARDAFDASQAFLPREMRAHRGERWGGMDDRARNEGRLARRRFRQHEGAAVAVRGERHGERAADRAKLSGKGQLSRELEPLEGPGRNLPRGRENAQREGEVEAAAFLRQVRGREVRDDAALRKLEAGGGERCADAVAGFLHFRLRQAHDVEAGQPAAHVDLDPHEGRLHARETAGENDGKRHARDPLPERQAGTGLARVSLWVGGMPRLERGDFRFQRAHRL